MKVIDLGLVDYAECWEFQCRIFEAVIERKCAGGGEIKDREPGQTPSTARDEASAWREGQEWEAGAPVILCEHPHVYTLGRNGKAGNMLVDETFLTSIGATFYRVDRGGDITYHGPGQLVVYPILDLGALGMGVRSYIEALEQTVIDTLASLGIAAGRRAGAAGVWLSTPLRKICAIGVRASRGVTMHGLALNVNTRLEYFSHINPCGFAPDAVTSVERETGHAADMSQVKRLFVEHFERVFGVRAMK